MRFIVMLAFVVFGQQQRATDFGGTWVLNPSKSEKAIRDGLSPIKGRMTITVTDTDVTFLNSVREDTQTKTVCVFGPEPAGNGDPMNRDFCSAKWDGAQLVTTLSERTYPLALKGTRTRRSTSYVVSGSELKLTGVLYRVDGGDPFTLTLFWERVR